MASNVSALIQMARYHLNEPTEDLNVGFWTDAELAALIDKGARDLWRAINDNFQHYFLTIDTSLVSQASGASTLTGMPADVGIVRGIEPVDLNARPGLNYVARDYNHVDFQRARAIGTQDPSQGCRVYYCITGAGGPVAAPIVQVAPVLSATVPLRVSYVPILATIVKGSPGAGQIATNPIPGESDNALVAWCVAYAKAKQSEDGTPDAGWLTIYGTEKTNILVSLTPRQTEDEDVAEAFFEDLWQ